MDRMHQARERELKFSTWLQTDLDLDLGTMLIKVVGEAAKMLQPTGDAFSERRKDQ